MGQNKFQLKSLQKEFVLEIGLNQAPTLPLVLDGTTFEADLQFDVFLDVASSRTW